MSKISMVCVDFLSDMDFSVAFVQSKKKNKKKPNLLRNFILSVQINER